MKKLITQNEPPEEKWYCERTKKDWIKWAEREIEEYERFIKFLKNKND